MSVRLFTTRLVKHGRYILQNYWKRDIHNNILEQNKNKTRNNKHFSAIRLSVGNSRVGNLARNALNSSVKSNTISVSTSTPSSGIFRVGQHARKLFVDNILKRVTTTYSHELRQQATKKLFYGDSAPFFALIGVSLASGTGILTNEDELEGVCWEIREAALRLQNLWNHDEISDSLDRDFNIDNLDIGPPIAKGCAAVVYAASLKNSEQQNDITTTTTTATTTTTNSTSVNDNEIPKNVSNFVLRQQSLRAEMMSPMQNMSRFVHNYKGSVDNINVLYNDGLSGARSLKELIHQHDEILETTNIERISLQANVETTLQPTESLESPTVSLNRYPIALKMMFNYDIQSNALAILRAMYKETVPARQRHLNEASEEWERLIQNQTLVLPPHPNIVCMYGFFCDEVRNFPDGHLLYPIAQPQRINPNGYGRNMSLYLLMKRYDYSLRALLDTHELSTRTKLLLLAQLLESVAHINHHGIAHRDLKSDNILIEMNDDDSPPVLVLSDFGCCLADKVHGLQVPYTSFDIDKGGNAALMAPEIINKQPGPFSKLNYSKSDLWACGAIAYEIFGMPNPFYSTSAALASANGVQTYSLRNTTYKQENLPLLPDECPKLIKQLIYNILNPNSAKRISPDIAANVIQLHLWAPSRWLKADCLPNSPEILQWLLSLTTKVMCDSRHGANTTTSFNCQLGGRRTYVEYLLICSFLTRAHLRRIRGALNWMQNVI